MYVENVAEGFVREYYSRLYYRPSSLHQLYAENASLVHGEEGDKPFSDVVRGTEPALELLGRDGFGHSKVCVTDVTALHASGTSISIVVTGDMKHGDEAPRMFVQSFVLFDDSQKGPLIMTDILKFLREQEASSTSSPGNAKSDGTKPRASSTVQDQHTNAEDGTGTDVKASSSDSTAVVAEPAEGADAKLGDETLPTAKPDETSARAPSESPASAETAAKEQAQAEGGEKPKKFKFSFDTIAKATSFQPKAAMPAYAPVPYTMGGGYSPTYSPSPTFPTAVPPHLPMQQIPYQYQMPHQFVPPMHGPQTGPPGSAMLSTKGYLVLSSDQLTHDQVARTLETLAGFSSIKVDSARKRGFIDFYSPDAIIHLGARGPIPIAGTNATVTVKPLRPGQRRGDNNNEF